jgi:hypothetical protein
MIFNPPLTLVKTPEAALPQMFELERCFFGNQKQSKGINY